MIRLKLISFLCVLGCMCLTFCNQERNNNKEGNIYQEPHRPQVHYSPKESWMGPISGLLYYGGTYHLFYQYNPDTTFIGTMHWGHAVSKDLIHWNHFSIALHPDSLGNILPGSVVVDRKNTSGFGSIHNPPLIAAFTYHNKEDDEYHQGFAYSLDSGRTWNKYKKNPILDNYNQEGFQNPDLIWHEESGKWIISLAANNEIRFYASRDLKNWNFLSSFGEKIEKYNGKWSKPDLFPLFGNGKNNRIRKWILLIGVDEGGPNGGSATRYFVGDFNGETFSNELKDIRWIDYGKDCYGGSTFSNIPNTEGRIYMGWMNNWEYAQLIPTHPWRGTLTFPRELNLKNIDGQYFLSSTPIRNLEKLRMDSVNIQSLQITKEVNLTDELSLNKLPIEMIMDFKTYNRTQIGFAENFGVKLSGDTNELLVGYDNYNKVLYINRSKSGLTDFSDFFGQKIYAPYFQPDSITSMHIIVDHSSIEVFVDEGKRTITGRYFNKNGWKNIGLYARNGTVEFTGGKIYQLKSIWQ